MKVILRTNKAKRKIRVRKKVSGTKTMPRITVFRSNKYIYAQLVDDISGKTLVDVNKEAMELHKGRTKVEAAFEVGKELAKKAHKAKISKAVFDRGSYKYHGRVKSLADGSREGGLKF